MTTTIWKVLRNLAALALLVCGGVLIYTAQDRALAVVSLVIGFAWTRIWTPPAAPLPRPARPKFDWKGLYAEGLSLGMAMGKAEAQGSRITEGLIKQAQARVRVLLKEA